MQALFKKILLPALETSMRSPSGWTGWLARSLMRTANPQSTQVGIQRLNLQPDEVFVELGAGEGAGLKAIFESGTTVPSRIVLVEISEDFRNDLTNVVDQYLPVAAKKGVKIEIHGTDCKHMPFLEDSTVDKIFAMNVVYFLNPLPEYLKELHRVLKPSGSVTFGCKFKVLPEDSTVFVNVHEEQITKSMEEAGFQVSREFIEVSTEDVTRNYVELKGTK